MPDTMPLTPQEVAEVDRKSRAFEKLYWSDLPDVFGAPTQVDGRGGGSD